MRIRDRLLALATASLAPSRAAPRGTAGGHERAHDRAHETGVSAGTPTSGAAPPAAELPRQLGEQLLQSIHASHQRLSQTAEALSVLAGAVVSAELALRQHLDAARGVGPPMSGSAGAGIMTMALHAANARALDGGYLFCGTSEAPFSAEGIYQGPASSGLLVVLPATPSSLAISSIALTGLAPLTAAVDIIPRLARAQAACGSSNPRVLETCYEPLAAAAAHLQLLQARVAAALAVLADATNVTEEAMPARSSLADSEPEQHPAQLAQTFGALEAARSLAERTLAIFPPSS